ncbi:unnamed protein product [Rotaria sp. Silwood2]|nr:unnamed protein product [Rotaria sp. Silwood2]CAF2811749.1 unnamed protein product [Rotaria sp. Silwood2]CAF3275185.1 unnamed protein product [Rotaria sp. Silwood2]CAF3895930.1 unnamed protein product [Rotaria sp. Silwood2]CAF3963719.1 unnamed protein product [Rotaria sp. Silwood2]
MGCGSSVATQVSTNSTASQGNANSQSEEISSSSSQKDVTERITSASSGTSSAIVKLSTGGKKSANSSMNSQNDVSQNLVIIWVDLHMNNNEKIYQDLITKLQRITTAIYTFTDSDQCIYCLDNINEKTVVLFVSDRVGE